MRLTNPMDVPIKKIKFETPKKVDCPGRIGTGDCMHCIKTNSTRAIGCKHLGEFLPKNDWNRIFKNSPLYNNDIKAHEGFEEDRYSHQVSFDKKGKFTGRRVA